MIRRPEAPAIDAVSEMEPDYELWRLQCEMEKLRLDESILLRSYATLSGGEQTKLQLAVLFSSEQHYLLIDEPTNHLDLPGRELVSRYLSRKRGFLLVSHDRAFLDGCVDHILSINRADIQVCRGNFSTWMENRERQEAIARINEEKLALEARRNQADKQAREKNSELLNLEREVSVLEQRKAAAALEEKTLLDKLWETYELSHEAARAQRVELESVPKAQRRVGELKKAISGLGNINLDAIEEMSEEYVVIVPSYMVYTADYEEFLQNHIESGADITLMYQNVDNAKDHFLNCQVLNLNNKKVCCLWNQPRKCKKQKYFTWTPM